MTMDTKGVLALIFGLSSALAMAQGGGFGGGGAAGAPQGGQGSDVRNSQNIDNQIQRYLSAEPHLHILTPGEYTEWPLKLEAGQVVIAEASSTAFDPALEIVDAQAKSLASNDDRYPGDQRPLLLWRCPAKGDYALRGRSFRDKAGGQYQMRFAVFDTVDISTEGVAVKAFDGTHPLLARITLQRGQIVEPYNVQVKGKDTTSVPLAGVISPSGLPDIGLMRPFMRTVPSTTLLAPADGDYYYYTNFAPHGSVAIAVHEYKPHPVDDAHRAKTASGGKSDIDIWEFKAKKGEILHLSTPELLPDSSETVGPQPVMPPVDEKKKDDWSPFYPEVLDPKKDLSPRFLPLRGRDRDGRVTNLKVTRDTTFWAVVRPLNRANRTTYSFNIAPAVQDLPDGKTMADKLGAGGAGFWGFDGHVGDVVLLSAASKSFVHQVQVLDPDLADLGGAIPPVDETATTMTLILRKPGQNIVQVSAYGDGGTGEYTISRKLLPPSRFGLDKPASGELDGTNVQVWTFDAKPGEPLLLSWRTTAPNIGLTVLDSRGNTVGLPLQFASETLAYGVLIVREPTTFVLVVQGQGVKAGYSLSLSKVEKG